MNNSKNRFLMIIALVTIVSLIACMAVGCTGGNPSNENTNPNIEGQTPNSGEQGQTPDSGEQDQTPDSGEQGQTPDSGEQGQTPDSGEQGQTPDSGEQGQTPDSGEQGQTPDSGDQGQTPDTGDQGQTPDSGDQGQTPDTGDQGQDPDTDNPGGSPILGTALNLSNYKDYLTVTYSIVGNEVEGMDYRNMIFKLYVNPKNSNFTYEDVVVKAKIEGKYYEGNYGGYKYHTTTLTAKLNKGGEATISEIYTPNKPANHIEKVSIEVTSISGYVKPIVTVPTSKIALTTSNVKDYLSITYSMSGTDLSGLDDYRNIKCYLYINPVNTNYTYEDVVVNVRIKGKYYEGNYGDYKYFTTTMTARLNNEGAVSLSKIYTPNKPANHIEKVSIEVTSISGYVNPTVTVPTSKIALTTSNAKDYLSITYSMTGNELQGLNDYRKIKCNLYINPANTNFIYEDVVVNVRIKGKYYEGNYGDYKYFTTTMTARLNNEGAVSLSKIYTPNKPANHITKVSLEVTSISGNVVV